MSWLLVVSDKKPSYYYGRVETFLISVTFCLFLGCCGRCDRNSNQTSAGWVQLKNALSIIFTKAVLLNCQLGLLCFFCFIENVYFYQFGFDQTLNTVKGRKTHMNFYSVTFKLNVEVLFSYLRTPSPTRHESGHLHGVISFPSLVIHFYRRKGWWCCGVFQGTGKGCGWCSGTSCRRFGWLCEQHIRRN